MPTLFFARNGTSPDRAKSICKIDMPAIMNHFAETKITYYKNPPIINKKISTSQYSDFTIVVLEVSDKEKNEKFTEAGFYWLQNITPGECIQLFDLQ